MKIGIIQPRIVVGAFSGNALALRDAYLRQVDLGADIVVVPEDAIAAYCEGDQRFYPSFIAKHDAALLSLINAVGSVPLVVGITEKNPHDNGEDGKPFFNTALFIQNRKILYKQSKTNLATDSVFNDYRWYEPNGGKIVTFMWNGKKCAMLVCQDLWEAFDDAHGEHYFQRHPVTELKDENIDLLFVTNASPYYHGKGRRRLEMIRAAIDVLKCTVVYANFAGGHDELVFDGRSVVVDANGEVRGVAKSFASDEIVVDLDGPVVDYPFDDGIGEMGEALITSLRDYVAKSGIKGVVLGLSGGIDSAVCAALAVRALGPDRVIGIRMPSQYSSEGSLVDAEALAQNLGIRCDTVKIEPLYAFYANALDPLIDFSTLAHPGDMTMENIQARIRGNILMAYSNKYGFMAIATGNKSEFSVGYSTLYGDMCGGFALIKDVYKMGVYRLAEWLNKDGPVIPESSITKPPSAELRPGQKDTDSLPDYPVLDAILRMYIEGYNGCDEIVAAGYDRAVVEKVIRMTDAAEFKRRQAPPGPIVSKNGTAWLNRQYPMQTFYRP